MFLGQANVREWLLASRMVLVALLTSLAPLASHQGRNPDVG